MRSTGNSTLQIEALPVAREIPLTPDDAALLRKIQHGSQSAFSELVQRHGRYLYRVAFSLTGNAADAEDVVQETFAAVIDSKFRGESAVRTWLVQILVRRSAMLQRSLRRSKRHTAAFGEAAAAGSGGSMGAGHAASSDARLDLAVMLETLSVEHRQVIVLREVEGMSYDEMATALDVPRGTVESRLHRARGELRARFKDYLQKP
jgi:RNA polymerase sigma-70 factor (ECF subfamily)